jgi:hypothetical protein
MPNENHVLCSIYAFSVPNFLEPAAIMEAHRPIAQTSKQIPYFKMNEETLSMVSIL